LLRILKLPESVLKEVEDGNISSSHARLLIREKEPEKVLKKLLSNKLSVHDAEKIQSNKQVKNKGLSKHSEIIAIEDLLKNILKSEVSIKMNQNEIGEIRIKFSNLANLDRILEVLGNINNSVSIPKFNKK
jgi:ParB family chromosome partitioning protein